ncbi:2-phosphosulfolactate phosphatase [Microbacterium sp. NPDC076911]|uniref:2-phosphosulfolactate phosphatase n=1 Tax=Microbacterium sp. NPDC076911 TaxID=3154958 RepID=UPI003441AE05
MQDSATPGGATDDSFFDQHRYQVRCEWGVEGLAHLEPAHIVIVVDVLRFSTTTTRAVEAGETVSLSAARARAMNGVAVADLAAATGSLVVIGCLRNASTVAREVAAEQLRRGSRTSVAVIAAGERVAGETGLRFAVEDHLGAGAIIDALTELGIDHTSPEAACAAEAFRGMRGATRHLLSASGSGQQLIASGLRDEVLAAAEVDASTAVPVLREGVFVDGEVAG